MHKGMDFYDLVCERNQRVAELMGLPPEERIEALLALRAEVAAARSDGMVLGDRQIALALIKARREVVTEDMILAKLADMGIPLDSPDADLRRAFRGVVTPTRCFRLAMQMRDRERPVQERLL